MAPRLVSRSSIDHRWHHIPFSWSKYPPRPLRPDLPAMRVLRIFFKLLFILFAVLGGTVLALVLAVYVGWRLLPAKSVPASTLLTLDIGDGVVEREPGDIFDRLAQGDALPMRTITVALDAAGHDDRVKGLLLRLGTGEVGIGQVQELREAIRAFHERSKA